MDRLRRNALALSWVTVAWNLAEGVVSVAAGSDAGSIALVGFGMDSFVESLSGCVMIWRLRGAGAGDVGGERAEERAERMIAATFFILAAYVLYEALGTLFSREAPAPSPLGIAVAAVSLVAMPALFAMKYRLGARMGMRSLMADSKETLACAFLSAALLAGLVLNCMWGLWWADPVAGLAIVLLLVREGWATLREGRGGGGDGPERSSRACGIIGAGREVQG